MTKVGFRRPVDHLKRLAWPVATAIAMVSIGAAIFLSRDWLSAFGPGRLFLRHTAATLVAIFLAVYPVFPTAAVFGLVLSLYILGRSRSGANPRAGWLRDPRAARWLLLCGTSLLSIGIAEAGAAAWLGFIHRLPAIPARFLEPTGPNNEILIVVIGGSSALGVPYDGLLSLGAVVRSELERAIPAHRFRVEILAEKGATLEAMHLKLAGLTRRPDALIVYSGHNEFLGRFSLANRVLYYDDERSGRPSMEWLRSLGRLSAVERLARENLEKQRIGLVPAQSFGAVESLVGRPVCTPADAELVFTEFERRLESIVVDCERVGCLPILIIPPGNDASDPSQSYAVPGTRRAARQALFKRLTEIRSYEEHDPAGAIAAYREILAEQPSHAQTHHRLARLLESAGLVTEANRHYVLARDHDGLPMRCSTRLETAYRTVAQLHERSVLLVDGPFVLKAKSQRGILDNNLFHDNVHPNLEGHVALANAVLSGLKDRAAFGWPKSTPAPTLEVSRVAADFKIDVTAWATVCNRSAAHYGQIAFLTIDSAARLEWRDRYSQAARSIEAGVAPLDTGIPGVGTRE
jgi:hypothetical protein